MPTPRTRETKGGARLVGQAAFKSSGTFCTNHCDYRHPQTAITFQLATTHRGMTGRKTQATGTGLPCWLQGA